MAAKDRRTDTTSRHGASNKRRDALRAAARRRARPAGPGRAVEPPAGAPHVFVSYAHKDVVIVRPLIDWLRNGGVAVVWDEDFAGGEDVDLAIRRAIESAGSVIVVWSQVSVRSAYVRGEARHAFKSSKLLPTHVAGLDLSDVPLDLGHLQAVPLDNVERMRTSLAAHGIHLRA